MGELGFGKSYGQLETGRMHPSIEAISKFLSVAVSAWQVPWALNLFTLIPGLPDPAWDMKHFAEVCVMERKEVCLSCLRHRPMCLSSDTCTERTCGTRRHVLCVYRLRNQVKMVGQ